ncbi:MAG: hypothetical protein WC385_03480 [Candidatus Paceibacterota bacterium]|jgi:hypothetical protein
MKKLFIVVLGLLVFLPFISAPSVEASVFRSRVGKLKVSSPVRAKAYEQGSPLKISWDTENIGRDLAKLDKVSFRFTLVEDKACSIGEECVRNKYQLVTQDFDVSTNDFYKLNLTSFAADVSPGRYVLGICPLLSGKNLTKAYVRKYCGLSGSFDINPSSALPEGQSSLDTAEQEEQFVPYEDTSDNSSYDATADQNNYDNYYEEPLPEIQTIPLSAVITSPPANFSYALKPINGEMTSLVSLWASASGGIAPYTYQWSEGNKSLGNGEKLNVNIAEIGSHTVTLLVTDTTGSQTTQTVSFKVVKGSDTGPFIPDIVKKAPQITSITSPVVASGTVTIVGTGFTPSGNVVSVGSALQTSISTSDGTTLKFSLLNRVPAGTYPVFVSNANGKSNEASLVITVLSRAVRVTTGQTSLLANIWNALLNLFK